jgi:hypothetical protein
MSTAPAIPRRVGCVHPAFSLQAAARWAFLHLAIRRSPHPEKGEVA